jgi:hypothetical protein
VSDSNARVLLLLQVISRSRRARAEHHGVDSEESTASSPTLPRGASESARDAIAAAAVHTPFERAEMSALEIDGELAPALGPTWAHCVSSRLLLMPRLAPQGLSESVSCKASFGTVTIVKSPCAPQLTLSYTISAKGWGPLHDGSEVYDSIA